MLTEITELCRQYTALLERLEEKENEAADLTTRLSRCTELCMESLRQFRKLIAAHDFPDCDTEIHFFKRIKPAITGRHIYYRKVHQLHLGELKGCWPKEKERLCHELDVIAKVFKEQETFWQYIRSGGTALDSVYFLRSHKDFLSMPFTTEYDEEFSTCGSGQLAELLALEMLMKYIGRLLREGEDNQSAVIEEADEDPIRWTGTQSEFTELVYFLYVALVLNQGKASLMAIKKALERAFRFEVPEFYHLGGQLFERKEPLRFVKRVMILFLRYLEGRIN